MLWFSALTRLNQTLEDEERKIEKYHEVVDMVIAYAIAMLFGGSHTRTAGVHVDNGGCSFVKNTNRKCDVNKGWRMEGRLVLFRLLMMMAMMFPMNDVHWNN